MSSTIAERKRADADVKSRSLREELERWRRTSEKTQPLEKHHTQIRRITARLDGLIDRIGAELDALRGDVQGQGRSIEEKLLTAHAIWEFFRAKLAQRLDPTFVEHLRVCDELAWQCYAPARDKFLAHPHNVGATANVKEPPLVFLNGGWSPYAVGRESAFQVERVSGGWLAQEAFREVVERLPVPLIGVPWFQVTHLPDALVIAHEAGHIVEWDFELRDDLDAALVAGVAGDRLDAWRAWLPETFADIYGCIAGGPAFGAALIDFLAQGKSKIAADKRNPGAWGTYPPAWARVQVLVEALRELGYDVDALAQRWLDAYGEPQANLEFSADPHVVARALLDCECKRMSISTGNARPPMVRELLPPLPVNPESVARNVGRGYASGSDDARVLIASARWLWEWNPDAYDRQQYDKQIRSLVATPPGTRGTPKSRFEQREEEDRALGVRWFDDLFGESRN